MVRGSPGTGRMQPHTDRPTTSKVVPQRGDEANLYERHHQALLIAVSHAINGSGALIEDACQTAWTILVRRQPNRASVFAWLYVVVIRTFVLSSGGSTQSGPQDYALAVCAA